MKFNDANPVVITVYNLTREMHFSWRKLTVRWSYVLFAHFQKRHFSSGCQTWKHIDQSEYEAVVTYIPQLYHCIQLLWHVHISCIHLVVIELLKRKGDTKYENVNWLWFLCDVLSLSTWFARTICSSWLTSDPAAVSTPSSRTQNTYRHDGT